MPRLSAPPVVKSLKEALNYLRGATTMEWAIVLACWFSLTLISLIISTGIAIDHARSRFTDDGNRLRHNIEQRLKTAELVMLGLGDIASESSLRPDIRLTRYASEAAKRYDFVYTMGLQPLVRSEERARFEQMEAQRYPGFIIKDYQHANEHNWKSRLQWMRAPERSLYLPWVTAEPSLPASANHVRGLDLLADDVVGPTLQRAIASAETELTPSFSLSDGASAFAYTRAVYPTQPPPDSPLLRREEAKGMLVLVVRTAALLDTGATPDDYELKLERADGAARHLDLILARHEPRQKASTLEHLLLPRLTSSQSISTPFFPYQLKLAHQVGFSILHAPTMVLCFLLSALPALMVLMMLGMRREARRSHDDVSESLHRERENAMVTLQAISDAVITFDIRRIVQYLNPTAARLMSIRIEEARERPLQELFHLRYEFSKQAMADPFMECLQRRCVVELAENSYLIRPSGDKLLIEGTISPLFDRSGSLQGAVLTFRDTAPVRRRMLEALEASEDRLREHEKELARVARINSMGEMTSGIAHEINQPLSAIMSYCQASLSLLEDDEPDLEMIHQAMHSAVSQAERAGKIVLRLRDFVSKRNQDCAPVDVNHAVLNALTLTEHEVLDSEVHLEYRPAANLPLAYADTIHLEQVVLNLIRNAIDAMQSVRPWGRLIIETSYFAERIRISVSDNGPGIPQETLERVFEPFFSTKQKGMGLGLTICQTIIESIGGQLSARNKTGGGAEFIVELPPLDARTFAQQAGVEPS